MKLHIRPATTADLPFLLEFEQGLIHAERPMDPRIRDEHVQYYDLPDFIQDPDRCLLVGLLQEQIVACGYAKILPDRPYLDQTHYAYLGFMYVPPQHRGNGYNQQILDNLVQWCHKRNIHEIRLDVYTVNESAINAYTKGGFKPYLLNMRLED